MCVCECVCKCECVSVCVSYRSIGGVVGDAEAGVEICVNAGGVSILHLKRHSVSRKHTP